MLATLDELREWVTPEQASDAKALTALVAASSLVRAHIRRERGWVNDDNTLQAVPDQVRDATCLIARRIALMPDDAVTDQTAGPFTVKRGTGAYVSATERTLLAPYCSGVTTMTVAGPIPWG